MLLIIGQNLFFHSQAQPTAHSPQPSIDFSYYKYVLSASLSVMPSYRVLHICRQGVQKTFFLPPNRIFFTKLLNIVEYLSSASFIDWQGHIYIFRIFWQFLHDYSNCNCLPWVIWKQAISFFSVHRYLHDHQSNIQNLEFSNKKLQFRGVNIVLSFLPFPSLCLFQQQFNFVCYSLMYILYWIKL